MTLPIQQASKCWPLLTCIVLSAAWSVLGACGTTAATNRQSRTAAQAPQPAGLDDQGNPTPERGGSQDRAVRSHPTDGFSNAEKSPEHAELPPLPGGTTVLHIGDSFAGALGIDLNKRFKGYGIKGVLRYETSSYIPTWAWRKSKLPSYLNRYDPDLVLITLGANELEIVNPEQRIPAIERIVERIGNRPCVWVATPLWKGPMNGLMDIIRQHAAPCLYLDTNELIPEMDRLRDKIHPSMAARRDWADTVVQWLRQRRHPKGDQPWALRPDPARDQ